MSGIILPEDLPHPPKYATRRNPDLVTRGHKVAAIATSMGKPMFSYQRYISDVANELNPPGSHLKYRYQEIIISMPRQTGKTVLQRPTLVERTLATPDISAFMCAQLGKYSTARWNDLVSDLEASPALFQFANIKRSKGDESLAWPNRSKICPFAPGRDAIHGETPEIVHTDECWKFTPEAGVELGNAVRPAQQTRGARQWWKFSAAGDVDSTWWEEQREKGRAATLDPNSRIAYFEWSMNEDDDPYDPASWGFHPGLEGLITLDDLAEEAKPENNSHADFLRGFMNIPTKYSEKTVINLEKWEKGTVEFTEDINIREWTLAYDVAIDESYASVYLAKRSGARIDLVLLEQREGSSWLAPWLLELLKKTRPKAMYADDGGPARLVTARLATKGHRVTVLDGRTSALSWASFKEHVELDALAHCDSTQIVEEIKYAVETYAGDVATLSRRRSRSAIPSLIAAHVAVYGAGKNIGLQMW
ncbi:hypothetical protein ACFSYH_05910 [Populibacterium corticicola]|uniref:Terminase n=1 Tax=Populibacterium corticicola TaxID=1812826 RepID=A0ABW5XGZ4_9MICO